MSYHERFARGYTVPHYECYKAAKTFRHRLHLLAVQSSAGNVDPQLLDFLSQGMEFVCLSNTVQLYAAMTIEAALNLCGVIEMGESAYYATKASSRRYGRLALVLSYAVRPDEDRDRQLREIMDQLARRRNDLVHPKPAELPIATRTPQLPRYLEKPADDALSNCQKLSAFSHR